MKKKKLQNNKTEWIKFALCVFSVEVYNIQKRMICNVKIPTLEYMR